MNKLNIINSDVKDGIISKDKTYFPNLSEEDINNLYNYNLEKYLKKLNLTLDNAIIINDSNVEEGYLILKSGKIKTSTSKEVVIMRSSLKNFYIGVETSDFPVIIGTVKKDNEIICGICLANLINLDNEILDKLVGYLIMETNCAPYDINFYISKTVGKDKLLIDKKYINSRVLKDFINKEKNGYYLDIRLAIFNELRAAQTDYLEGCILETTHLKLAHY